MASEKVIPFLFRTANPPFERVHLSILIFLPLSAFLLIPVFFPLFLLYHWKLAPTPPILPNTDEDPLLCFIDRREPPVIREFDDCATSSKTAGLGVMF